jgi:hypothetical protein
MITPTAPRASALATLSPRKVRVRTQGSEQRKREEEMVLTLSPRKMRP